MAVFVDLHFIAGAHPAAEFGFCLFILVEVTGQRGVPSSSMCIARPLTTASVTAGVGCMVVPLFSANPFTYCHILSRLSCLGSAIATPLAKGTGRGGRGETCAVGA